MRAVQSIGGTLLPRAACVAASAAPDGRMGWLGLASAEAAQICGQRLNPRAHACFERGLILAVYPSDRRFALALVGKDAGHSVALRGGMVPAAELLEGEGCSP